MCVRACVHARARACVYSVNCLFIGMYSVHRNDLGQIYMQFYEASISHQCVTTVSSSGDDLTFLTRQWSLPSHQADSIDNTPPKLRSIRTNCTRWSMYSNRDVLYQRIHVPFTQYSCLPDASVELSQIKTRPLSAHQSGNAETSCSVPKFISCVA